MLIFYLYTIFLLFVVIGFLLGVQALIEWRRADLDDYRQRYLNKSKQDNQNDEEETQEHD